MTKQDLMNERLDGIVRAHSCRTKLEATGTGKDDPSYRLDIKVDFTGWTVQDVVDLCLAPLVISRQRIWKGMTITRQCKPACIFILFICYGH